MQVVEAAELLGVEVEEIVIGEKEQQVLSLLLLLLLFLLISIL